MNKKILFYSSISDLNMFKLTGFYVEDIKALNNAGYNVKTTNNPFLYLFFWNYNISYFYFYKKSFFPAFISYLFFKKIIFTGGIDELSPLVEVSATNRFIFKFLFVLNYIISDKCNIVSHEDFKNTSKLLNSIGIKNPKKLKYFPHSIDVNKFNDTLKLPKENIICTICWMGAISNVKRKGVDVTIQIFKKIVELNPEFKLYIIGSWGPGKDYLNKIINDLDISDFVYFTGPIDENFKLNILNRSKFYFQLSKYEGFGIAVIEAMALNNYIFHTGKGGLMDTVGINGYILEDLTNIDKVVNEFKRINDNFQCFDSVLSQNASNVNELFSTISRSNNLKNIIDNV